MNIQRFTAATSREAMAKARRMFGDSAVILSSRSTDEGFEVMAAAEESLGQAVESAPLAARSQRFAPIVTRNAPARATATVAAPSDSVEDDVETLSMSTLSFQEYVRERMLRKRRAALEAAEAAPALQEVRRAAEPRRAPLETARSPRGLAGEPLAAAADARPSPAVADLRRAAPVAAMPAMPQPIRTRATPDAGWEPPAAAAPVLHSGGAGQGGDVALELSALKDMIEERFNTLAWLGSSKQNPVQAQLMLKLIRAGFSPAMARAVLERIPADTAAPEAQRWVLDVLIRNLKVAPAGASLCDEGGVISLVGATGVGKTTTAAKLAAQCVKQFGPGSVGLITLDTYRVSGYEQLRSYARMLGLVAHLAHDRAALKDLLNLLSGKRLVIIDTAGLGQRDQRIQEMLDVLDMPKMKKTLVLNAGAHGDTLDEVLTAFKPSALHGVVLSKVDEAVKLGPAVDALIRHQVVLRGVANGQRVPEDWQNPDAAALVRMSMGPENKSAFDPLSSEMGFYFSQAPSRRIDLGVSHV